MIVAEVGASPLLLLALLACPIGMGAMMWFMAKGMRGGGEKHHPGADDRPLADLKAEQARLADKIEALEDAGRPEPRERAEAS